MENANDPFNGQKPIKTIRSTSHIIGGLLLLALSLFMLCGIFLFGLKAELWRGFICLLFGIPGALGVAVSILMLRIRLEVYEDGFAIKPAARSLSYISAKDVYADEADANRLILEKDHALYSECTGKIPVYAENMNGEKYLHHYIITNGDGSIVTLSKWELAHELTERLKLDELPVVRIKGL